MRMAIMGMFIDPFVLPGSEALVMRRSAASVALRATQGVAFCLSAENQLEDQ